MVLILGTGSIALLVVAALCAVAVCVDFGQKLQRLQKNATAPS